MGVRRLLPDGLVWTRMGRSRTYTFGSACRPGELLAQRDVGRARPPRRRPRCGGAGGGDLAARRRRGAGEEEHGERREQEQPGSDTPLAPERFPLPFGRQLQQPFVLVEDALTQDLATLQVDDVNPIALEHTPSVSPASPALADVCVPTVRGNALNCHLLFLEPPVSGVKGAWP